MRQDAERTASEIDGEARFAGTDFAFLSVAANLREGEGMAFRAVLNLDVKKKGGTWDEYQRLIVALIQAGWTYVGTSAAW